MCTSWPKSPDRSAAATHLETAAVSTLLDDDGKVGRDVVPEFVQLRSIDGVSIAKGSQNDIIRHVGEEVAGDLGTAGVGAIKGRGEESRLAGRVELEVRLALGEQHALEVGQRSVDLRDGAPDGGVLADDAAEAAVVELEDEAADELTLDDGEELVSARVRVRDVEAAGVDETDSHGNVRADEGGEVVQGGQGDGATGGALNGVVDEGEGDVGGIRGVGQEDALTVREAGSVDESGLESSELRRGGSVAVEVAGTVILTRDERGREGSGREGSGREGSPGEEGELDHFGGC